MVESRLLKKDLFGEVRFISLPDGDMIERDSAAAPRWTRSVARALLRREAAALTVLDGIAGIPELTGTDGRRLTRRFIPGRPLYEARPTDPAFFREALRLLRRLHGRNVAHNDLAKEPNILVQAGGAPAFIDFQLAWAAPRRGRLFRLLAYEDLRHLLKHKRTYCRDRLTARQLRILARPSRLSRLYRQSIKRIYLFVTRRLLGWSDREGAEDRGRRP